MKNLFTFLFLILSVVSYGQTKFTTIENKPQKELISSVNTTPGIIPKKAYIYKVETGYEVVIETWEIKVSSKEDLVELKTILLDAYEHIIANPTLTKTVKNDDITYDIVNYPKIKIENDKFEEFSDLYLSCDKEIRFGVEKRKVVEDSYVVLTINREFIKKQVSAYIESSNELIYRDDKKIYTSRITKEAIEELFSKI